MREHLNGICPRCRRDEVLQRFGGNRTFCSHCHLTFDRILPANHCGLNADWSCRAWAVRGDLVTNASVFILDMEDGTFALVQRFFQQPDTHDGPSAYHWGELNNDHIEILLEGLTEDEACMCLEKGR